MQKEPKTQLMNNLLFEIALNKVYPVHMELDLVNIAVVGEKMKEHQGISGKLFSSLGAIILTSVQLHKGLPERNISIIIDDKNTQKALNTLHESYFESQIKQLNLFITGVGNVGSKLLEQINQQTEYLENNLRLKIRVMALSNSRKMLLSNLPISLSEWRSQLDQWG